MRVLHLIDLRENSDEAVTVCRAATLSVPGRHRIVAVGASRAVELARAAGLDIDAAVPPVGPWPELASRRLRRLLNDRDGRDATRPWADVVQCWSPSMLSLARLSSGHRTPPRVGALLRPPVQPLVGVRSARMRFGMLYATLFAPDRFTRASWAEPASARRGGRLLEQNIRLLDPSTTVDGHAGADRAAARAELELEDDDVAVMLLADPPSAADGARFTFLLGLLFTTGVRVVGLMRAGATHQRRASRFVRMHGRRWGLISSHHSTDFLLAAADAAVWDVGDAHRGGVASAGAVTIGRAIARGVPVAAARHPLSLEALGVAGNGLVARDATLSALAERLLPWCRDAALRRDLGSRLARGPRSGHAFAPDLRRLWEEVTNTPLARPGLPVPPALARVAEGAAC